MKIKEVDWAALEHAYGRATDVPDILRRLASADAGDREGACYDMYGSLCHQGSVYSATAAAVPFLVDMAVDPDYPERAALLRFLGDACHGYDVGLPAVRAALAEQAPRLATLLIDPDPEVQLHVLWILSAPELTVAAKDVFRRTADQWPGARALAWLCLAELDPDRHLIPDTCADEDGAVRLAWALASVTQGDREGIALLVDLLIGGDNLERLHGWTSLVTEDSPLERCGSLLDSADTTLLDAMCAALVAERNGGRALSLYGMLLEGVFEYVGEGDGPTTDELDERQKRVLAAIADSDAAWEYDGNLISTLADYGIDSPFDRVDFVRTYGHPTAMVVTPQQVPAAAAVAAELGRHEWLGTPFIFGRGWGEDIAAAIPEDPADFPPEVMDHAERIAQPMLRQVVGRRWRTNVHWAFYPQLTVDRATEIFAGLGYAMIAPKFDAVDPDEVVISASDERGETVAIDEADATPCVPYAELPEGVRRQLAAFVDTLDGQGWSEVRHWYESVRGMGAAGVVMTPLALGRRFAPDARAEASFHAERADGGQLWTYVRVVLVESDGVPLSLVLPLAETEDGHDVFRALAEIALAQPAPVVLTSVVRAASIALLEIDGELQRVSADVLRLSLESLRTNG